MMTLPACLTNTALCRSSREALLPPSYQRAFNCIHFNSYHIYNFSSYPNVLKRYLDKHCMIHISSREGFPLREHPNCLHIIFMYMNFCSEIIPAFQIQKRQNTSVDISMTQFDLFNLDKITSVDISITHDSSSNRSESSQLTAEGWCRNKLNRKNQNQNPTHNPYWKEQKGLNPPSGHSAMASTRQGNPCLVLCPP